MIGPVDREGFAVIVFMLLLLGGIAALCVALKDEPCPPFTSRVCRSTLRVQSTVEANGMPGTILIPEETCVCKGHGK